MMKIKWPIILIVCAFMPLVGVPWIIYELWNLHNQGKLSEIISILEDAPRTQVNNNPDEIGKNYSNSEVSRFKNVLVTDEDFWDKNLSVEFCIALRTRDIFLSRKIVEDFSKSKTHARAESQGDHLLEIAWQSYFKEYVKSEKQIAAFLSLFIKPSADFMKDFSESEEHWNLFITQKSWGQVSSKWEALSEELTTLFSRHMNRHYWQNEPDWYWFFCQYLYFLVQNKPPPEIRRGFEYFETDVVQIQKIVESSGWQIDYSLHANPLKVWGGQSLRSKLQNWLRGRELVEDIKGKMPFFWN